MTALLLLMPGTPMLFQGQEFGASSAVPLLRRSQAGARRGGAEGTRRVPRAVPEPGVAGDAGALAGAARPGDVRALQAATGPSATRTRRTCGCTAICSRCGATRRGVPRSSAPAPSTAPCSAPRRSCCASRREHADDERLLVVNLGADLVAGVVRRAAAGAARRPRRGSVRWSSEHPGLRRHRHARRRDRRRLAHPGPLGHRAALPAERETDGGH